VPEDFLAIDTDQQGTISLAEFRDIMVQNYGVSDKDVVEIFKAMDANHDSEIHYSEFLAAMLSTRIDLRADHINVTFRNFDKDLSGYITADNLREAFGTTFSGKNVESLLKEADILEDGQVSFDEFTAFVRDAPMATKEVGLPYPTKPKKGMPGRVVGGCDSAGSPQCCTIM